ncbi:MAG TPA: hypothetical protein VN702_14835 [Acetobacteraceae bacterium]|nr:hypothetical protein [Acetobacteraceae bacterium]
MATKRVEADPLLSCFDRLTEADRRYLAHWLEHARESGIDDVRDLSRRGTLAAGIPADLSIIGVYRAGQALASWLVVGRRDGWVAASCTQGTVSCVRDLPGSLALIHAAPAKS